MPLLALGVHPTLMPLVLDLAAAAIDAASELDRNPRTLLSRDLRARLIGLRLEWLEKLGDLGGDILPPGGEPH